MIKPYSWPLRPRETPGHEPKRLKSLALPSGPARRRRALGKKPLVERVVTTHRPASVGGHRRTRPGAKGKPKRPSLSE